MIKRYAAVAAALLVFLTLTLTACGGNSGGNESGSGEQRGVVFSISSTTLILAKIPEGVMLGGGPDTQQGGPGGPGGGFIVNGSGPDGEMPSFDGSRPSGGRFVDGSWPDGSMPDWSRPDGSRPEFITGGGMGGFGGAGLDASSWEQQNYKIDGDTQVVRKSGADGNGAEEAAAIADIQKNDIITISSSDGKHADKIIIESNMRGPQTQMPGGQTGPETSTNSAGGNNP